LNLLRRRLCLAALLSVGIVYAAPNAAHSETMNGTSLVRHLRQGGYVLLMRHAHSPSAPPHRSMANPDNVNLERQLDEVGRETARSMGQAIKKLRIPVGAVLSSPTYRALETVRLAGLGHPQTFPQLGDGGQSMMRDAVTGEAAWLRTKVSEPPKAGSNTVIVTHMPNIQAAFPQEATGLADGEALVFRPSGQGQADLISRVKIEDWPKLADN
jgi:phosphohistidine phosphatase SixA